MRTSMPRHACGGYTLIEITIVVVLIGMLAAMAIPAYRGYIDAANVGRAISDIGDMQLQLKRWETNNGAYPATLAEIGLDGRVDPWGNPYRYLRLTNANRGAARKDRNLVPINTDYDLYSIGKDAATAAPMTAAFSRDDVVRASNGAYIGLAEEY